MPDHQPEHQVRAINRLASTYDAIGPFSVFEDLFSKFKICTKKMYHKSLKVSPFKNGWSYNFHLWWQRYQGLDASSRKISGRHDVAFGFRGADFRFAILASPCRNIRPTMLKLRTSRVPSTPDQHPGRRRSNAIRLVPANDAKGRFFRIRGLRRKTEEHRVSASAPILQPLLGRVSHTWWLIPMNASCGLLIPWFLPTLIKWFQHHRHFFLQNSFTTPTNSSIATILWFNSFDDSFLSSTNLLATSFGVQQCIITRVLLILTSKLVEHTLGVQSNIPFFLHIILDPFGCTSISFNWGLQNPHNLAVLFFERASWLSILFYDLK